MTAVCIRSSKKGCLAAPLIGYRHFCPFDYSSPATKTCRPGTPDYCSSLVTSCCMLLAWARAEIPVWLRISYFDMLEVAAA